MEKTGKTILVTGATGKQGGAVAHNLLSQGWHIRALTRNADGPAAKALAAQGAEIAQGDFEHHASLQRAAEGVYGVFSVQNFWGIGAEAEMRQGRAIADAAKAAGVKHFVYSSVGGAERKTGIPHFDSKWQIEEYVRKIGLANTVLRPVYFMENLFWQRDNILKGMLFSQGLQPERKLQMIAVNDIGVFAAMAFDQPDRFLGQALEIGGDELTETETAQALSRATGHLVQVMTPPADPSRPVDKERLTMVQWFNDAGYQADIPALRRLYPGLATFDTWLHQTGWDKAGVHKQAA